MKGEHELFSDLVSQLYGWIGSGRFGQSWGWGAAFSSGDFYLQVVWAEAVKETKGLLEPNTYLIVRISRAAQFEHRRELMTMLSLLPGISGVGDSNFTLEKDTLKEYLGSLAKHRWGIRALLDVSDRRFLYHEFQRMQSFCGEDWHA